MKTLLLFLLMAASARADFTFNNLTNRTVFCRYFLTAATQNRSVAPDTGDFIPTVQTANCFFELREDSISGRKLYVGYIPPQGSYCLTLTALTHTDVGTFTNVNLTVDSVPHGTVGNAFFKGVTFGIPVLMLVAVAFMVRKGLGGSAIP